MRVTEATAAFKTCLTTLHVRSVDAPEFIDITAGVDEFLAETRIQNGFARGLLQAHDGGPIIIQENEPLLKVDMASFVERLAPRACHYRHNDFSVRTVHMHEDECPNGHSHCQHLVLGTSEYIPVIDGRLALGQWQRIFMVELDAEKAAQIGHRDVLVQVMGV